MGRRSTRWHTIDKSSCAKGFANRAVALPLMELMTYDSIIKPSATTCIEPPQPLVPSYTPPAPKKTAQQLNGYFQPTCALALDGQIAKRMDFDTQRRQLIYESLQEQPAQSLARLVIPRTQLSCSDETLTLIAMSYQPSMHDMAEALQRLTSEHRWQVLSSWCTSPDQPI